MTSLERARANVAARMRSTAGDRRDEARILAAADQIEAGISDSWSVRHEVRRIEAEGVGIGDEVRAAIVERMEDALR